MANTLKVFYYKKGVKYLPNLDCIFYQLTLLSAKIND